MTTCSAFIPPTWITLALAKKWLISVIFQHHHHYQRFYWKLQQHQQANKWPHPSHLSGVKSAMAERINMMFSSCRQTLNKTLELWYVSMIIHDNNHGVQIYTNPSLTSWSNLLEGGDKPERKRILKKRGKALIIKMGGLMGLINLEVSFQETSCAPRRGWPRACLPPTYSSDTPSFLIKSNNPIKSRSIPKKSIIQVRFSRWFPIIFVTSNKQSWLYPTFRTSMLRTLLSDLPGIWRGKKIAVTE